MKERDAALGPGPRTESDPLYSSSPFEPSGDPINDLAQIDLTDLTLFDTGDPHGVWRLLRQESPVHWHAGGARGTHDNGFWAVTSFDGCNEVHRRADLFSVSETIFMDFLPEDIPHQIMSMDPPEHSAYRRIPQRFFTAKTINALEDDVRAIVTGVLDEASKIGAPFNFQSKVAAVVPLLATAQLFGIPPSAAASLAGELGELGQGDEVGQDGAEPPNPLAAFTAALLTFFDEYTRSRSFDRDDSLIAAIVGAQVNDKAIERQQALYYLWILFLGAIDTTAHSSSLGMLSLFHHPDQLNRLREDPSIIPSAVTEILRWTSSSNVLKHVVRADTELLGTPLRKGDFVATYLPSANRDEKVFTDPYRFDVGRGRESPILTFGAGPHMCLGHLFARLELRVLFEELLRRFPDVEQAGPARRGRAFTMLLSPLADLPVSLGKPHGDRV